MSTVYWPYDEVKLLKGKAPGEFVVQAPWISTQTVIGDNDIPRAARLADKYATETVGPTDLADINWFFGALRKYPLCYELARKQWAEDLDVPTLQDRSLVDCPPNKFLELVISRAEHFSAAQSVSESLPFLGDWSWDAQGALQFSVAQTGVDPKALFSVVRRFHLLNAMQWNRTSKLYEKVKARVAETDWFTNACQLMVRQNHYVTQRCDGALKPALTHAKSAREKVEDFIKDERGHDRILGLALVAMGVEAEAVPVTAQSKILMDLLEFCAQRNFLAFAMAVDMFEASPYQETDPLADVLTFGGFTQAAKQKTATSR